MASEFKYETLLADFFAGLAVATRSPENWRAAADHYILANLPQHARYALLCAESLK